MLDIHRSDLTLGIVGSGMMGRGIAQIAAQCGVRVLLCDSRAGAAGEACDALAQTFSMLAGKGKLSEADAAAATARLGAAAGIGELAGCHIVLEAIVEDLEAKRALFRQLEEVVGDDCLLATNTSSLSVTAIGAACRLPQRVGGFHFFSPVPLMKVVEVIDGMLGAPWVGAALTALARRMGHAPVRATDSPGFIVNHAGRGYLTEALRVLGEGIAEPAAIDRIMRGAGFRMGPFELLDLTGLDVSHPVMETIYEQYYQEPRYRPSPITRQRLAAGLLGRKSGRGFYEYPAGAAAAAPAPARTDVAVWLSRRNAQAAPAVLELLGTLGARIDDGAAPRADSLCLVLPQGQDATASALDEGLDPRRTVALDTLAFGAAAPGWARTLMQTPLTSQAMRDAAWGLLAADGAPVEVIHDSPGFVAQRVLAMIVNIGCDMAQQRIATPDDIDRAVTLGLGYPKGPLALGDALGAASVLAVLDALYQFYRDPRYRPSPWLNRRARLGVSLLTPENA
jgi:3-hydroxybutyryl-CoA dehydrogenase